MEYVELLTGDLPLSLNDVIRERDELITEVQRLKEELGNANEYGDCEHNYADCLKREIKQAREERDDAREYADRERQLAYELKAERDELIQRLTTEQIMNAELEHEAELAREERDYARKCAEEMRDLYAAEIDESIAAFPFSWEREE